MSVTIDHSIFKSIVPSTCLKFTFTNNMAQNFALPNTIMFYCFNRKCDRMLQKPIKYFFKLYSLCKFFFSKIRIIPCRSIRHDRDNGIVVYTTREQSAISYEQCHEMQMYYYPEREIATLLPIELDENDAYSLKRISEIIPKICNYKVCVVTLINQAITLKEFTFLTLNDKCEVFLMGCIVTNQAANGLNDIVPVEELLKVSPNMAKFSIICNHKSHLNYCTAQTAQNLAALPPLKYLRYFAVSNVPETFDSFLFVTFIKNTYKLDTTGISQYHRFDIYFNDNVNPLIIKKFKEIVELAIDEIRRGQKNGLECRIRPY